MTKTSRLSVVSLTPGRDCAEMLAGLSGRTDQIVLASVVRRRRLNWWEPTLYGNANYLIHKRR